MYYLSKALVFISCLAASIFVAWWVGLVALIISPFYLKNTTGEVVR